MTDLANSSTRRESAIATYSTLIAALLLPQRGLAEVIKPGTAPEETLGNGDSFQIDFNEDTSEEFEFMLRTMRSNILDMYALGGSAKKEAVDGLGRVLAGVEHELDVALGGEIH